MSPKRKTPYKHPVSAHTRSNKPVTNYVRGKGNQIIQQRRSRVVGETGYVGPFDITINYVSDSEQFSVEAKDYGGALTRGMENRDDVQRPSSINMRLFKPEWPKSITMRMMK
ncbi:MAG: hypothetical protein H8E40_01350 [Chloroflexi bacterium]|nr:hypothetical protein [Chloroflexota bacterium]